MLRRQAIHSLALGGATLRLGSEALTGLLKTSAPTEQESEAFWSRVADAFEPQPGRVNLVTAVRGVHPRQVHAAVVQEAARLNAFAARATPDPEWRNRVRAKAAALIGAEAKDVALVRNTTEGVTTVLLHWPLQRGDEVLTSPFDHGPFYDTLAFRAHRDGIVPRTFACPAPARSSAEIVESVERAMTPRTRLVLIGQVLLTGQIMPVRDIAAVVHRRGAHLLVDGVLALGHVPVDVREMDADFYAAGFHKWGCGPRATAVFYVRPGLVERLPPLFGAVDDDRKTLTPLWSSARTTKYESFGAHPDAHWVALEPALDFLQEIGVARIQRRLHTLSRRWFDRVQDLPAFHAAVHNDPAHYAGLIAWDHDVDEGALFGKLRAAGILLGGTEPYRGVAGRPGPRSFRIANTALFTRPADVDRFADVLHAALQ